MRAKPYQQLRDELFTPEQQMENAACAQEIMESLRTLNTKTCGPQELEESFKTFLGRFNGEGTNLRCELVTGIEGMRFVAVFNWDDMG